MRIIVKNSNFSLPLSSFTLRGPEEHRCPVCNCYVPEQSAACPGCGEPFPSDRDEDVLTVSPEALDAMILRRKEHCTANPKNEQEMFRLEDERDKYHMLSQQAPTRPTQPEPSTRATTGSIPDKTMWTHLATLLLAGIAAVVTISHIPTAPKQPALPEPDESAMEEVLRPEDLSVLDYVQVYEHGDDYEGQTVVIAGKISRVGDHSLRFLERFAYDDASSSFQVDLYESLPRNTKASDLYQEGQYVIVRGTVSGGDHDKLYDAEVLFSGDEAKPYVDAWDEAWHERGQSLAQTLPLTDYMEILEDPEPFQGQRVRVAGQVESIGSNRYRIKFSFHRREPGGPQLDVNLQGCPDEMSAACVEGTYAVLSGVVDHGLSTTLIDCYVECTGEEAEPTAKQSEADWKQRWREQREAYISACEPYDYEQLTRYPDQYEGVQTVISGRVVQIYVALSWDDILLDTGNGDLVYVHYEGKQYHDPEILKNDQITFYGKYDGKRYYTISETESERLPYLTAQYSSINA